MLLWIFIIFKFMGIQLNTMICKVNRKIERQMEGLKIVMSAHFNELMLVAIDK